MRQDLYRTIGVIVAGATALIGIAAAIHVLVNLPIPDNKGPEWIAAIGTVGALIGTIWIATAAERRRRREQRDLAVIAAAEFAMRIAVVQSALGSALKILPRSLDGDPRATYSDCAKIIEDGGIWSGPDLVPLVHVRKHAAAKLATTGVSLKWISRLLNQAAKSDNFNLDKRGKFCEVMGTRMQQAIDELQSPLDQCIAFSQLHDFHG